MRENVGQRVSKRPVSCVLVAIVRLIPKNSVFLCHLESWRTSTSRWRCILSENGPETCTFWPRRGLNFLSLLTQLSRLESGRIHSVTKQSLRRRTVFLKNPIFGCGDCGHSHYRRAIAGRFTLPVSSRTEFLEQRMESLRNWSSKSSSRNTLCLSYVYPEWWPQFFFVAPSFCLWVHCHKVLSHLLKIRGRSCRQPIFFSNQQSVLEFRI